MDETSQKYWDEIISAISDIETHGEAIEYLMRGQILAANSDIGALMSERDELAQERDALIAERDDYKTRLENAQAEIRSRWTDLTNGGSITLRTDFTKPGGTPEVEEPATIQSLNFGELMMDGGTE